jgi:hypothetical protein
MFSAMGAYQNCEITASLAHKALRGVEAAVITWTTEADMLDIPKAEQALMERGLEE